MVLKLNLFHFVAIFRYVWTIFAKKSLKVIFIALSSLYNIGIVYLC